jgi:hypothetical protein
MTGYCAIWHANGWAVSNDAKLDEDKDFDPEKKILTGVLTLKINAIFEAKGNVFKGDKIECIFKSETDKKLAFVGTIKIRGKQLTVIDNLHKSERYNEILNKIKTWQIHQA